MMAYTKPQKRKKEESERLRGERDQIFSSVCQTSKYIRRAFMVDTKFGSYGLSCENDYHEVEAFGQKAD